MLIRILIADTCTVVLAQDPVAFFTLESIDGTAFQNRIAFLAKTDSLFTKQNLPFYSLRESVKDSCKIFYISSGIRLSDSVKIADPSTLFANEILTLSQFKGRSQDILKKYSNAGYPFARVVPDILYYDNTLPIVEVKVDSGPRIVIDSIVVKSEKPIDLIVLKRIAGLRLPMLFNQKKLEEAQDRIVNKGFLEFTAPTSFLFTEEGSILYLYARRKQSVFGDLLIGLNSDNQRRTVLTGEAQFALLNVFGKAENISVQWRAPATQQQFLHFRSEFPFLFHSPLGTTVEFQVFRQDSTFARFNMRVAGTYFYSSSLSAGLGWYRESSSSVRSASEGLMPYTSNFQFFKIQYSNKRGAGVSSKGFRNSLEAGVGTITKDDTQENRLRLLLESDADIPIAKRLNLYTSLVFKTVNGPAILLNESYRTGGMGSIRGFNEWSFFVSSAVLGVFEYRFYVDSKSFFKAFYDAGWQVLTSGGSGYYQGFGSGLALPVANGLFHFDIAVGKFPNMPVDWRNTRLHIGFRSNLSAF